MLVYDLCNSRSWLNLGAWIEELKESGITIPHQQQVNGDKAVASQRRGSLDVEDGGVRQQSSSLPFLLIGNKQDVAKTATAPTSSTVLPGHIAVHMSALRLDESKLQSFFQLAMHHHASSFSTGSKTVGVSNYEPHRGTARAGIDQFSSSHRRVARARTMTSGSEEHDDSSRRGSLFGPAANTSAVIGGAQLPRPPRAGTKKSS